MSLLYLFYRNLFVTRLKQFVLYCIVSFSVKRLNALPYCIAGNYVGFYDDYASLQP